MGGILLFNKPFGVICQFSRDGLHPTLADYISLPDLYPDGRLDTDNEGQSVLTRRQQVAAFHYRSKIQAAENLVGAGGRCVSLCFAGKIAMRREPAVFHHTARRDANNRRALACGSASRRFASVKSFRPFGWK